jgi:hypothetical protein
MFLWAFLEEDIGRGRKMRDGVVGWDGVGDRGKGKGSGEWGMGKWEVDRYLDLRELK